MTWDEIKQMTFTPIERTTMDEAAGLHRYAGPDGLDQMGLSSRS